MNHGLVLHKNRARHDMWQVLNAAGGRIATLMLDEHQQVRELLLHPCTDEQRHLCLRLALSHAAQFLRERSMQTKSPGDVVLIVETFTDATQSETSAEAMSFDRIPVAVYGLREDELRRGLELFDIPVVPSLFESDTDMLRSVVGALAVGDDGREVTFHVTHGTEMAVREADDIDWYLTFALKDGLPLRFTAPHLDEEAAAAGVMTVITPAPASAELTAEPFEALDPSPGRPLVTPCVTYRVRETRVCTHGVRDSLIRLLRRGLQRLD